jgi:choloylglycine hydrolase
MKCFVAFIFIAVLFAISSSACTTFLLNKNGQLVFGRNYDWVTSAGIVCTNLRGLKKTSMKGEEGTPVSWVSEYGSISFNQYGKEFPNGGMNEKGLVVEMMWLDATQFPAPDARSPLNVLQWIQYQLDQCATVEEVIATDKTIRISSKGTPVHYLVADARGNVATIEFLNGKMVVHKGKELPFAVLTNNTYDESIQKTKGTSESRSFADNSIDRFAKACNMVQQFQAQNISTPAVDYAFSILSRVSQNEWTKWSIVYDITNKRISFKSHDFTEIKTLSFSAFDFNCTSTPKMFNINQNQKGDVATLFKDFSIAEGKPVLEAAISESRKEVNIPDNAKEALLNYSREVKCK